MASPEEYSQTVLKQAIARASLALGFKNAQPDVLECLSDVMQQCIQKMATECATNAQLHGRAQPGIQDALEALESLRPLKSGWKDLRDFAFPELTDAGAGEAPNYASSATSSAAAAATANNTSTEASEPGDETKGDNEGAEAAPSSSSRAWRQPFPYGVPNYPVRHVAKKDEDNGGSGGNGSSSAAALEERAVHGSQVPRHLPDYPPQHTYPHKTKSSAGSSSGGRSSRKRQAERLAMDKEVQKLKREAGSSVSKSLAAIEDCADKSTVE